MPWSVTKSSKCPPAKPWAVVKDADGSLAGCHPTKAKALKQQAALYANEPSASAGGNSMEAHAHSTEDAGCVDCAHDERAVDNSAWDGGAAMSSCAKSATPASCYGSICAGKRSGDTSKQDAWALPHHKAAGGPANAAGVRNALSRLPQTQGLTNRSAAEAHLNAHMSSISPSSKSSGEAGEQRRPERPPRDNLVRGVFPFELREDANAQAGSTMYGHFAVFREWTEIDSFWEGRFMESIDPGSFTKTFDENRDGIKVLFNHGKDPQLGNQVLGSIDELREDEVGAYYEVPLYDGIPPLLLNGLRDGQYGASFRFRVTREEMNNKPECSEWNPEGIPERVIKEVALAEFGPVTFPAYEKATAGVRSLTDDYFLLQFGAEPSRVAEFLAHYSQHRAGAAPQDHSAEEPHPVDGAANGPRELTVIRNPQKQRGSDG